MIFFPKRAIRAGKIFHTADRHRGGVRRFEFVLRLVLGKKCAARAACIPRVKHSVNGAKAYRSRVLRDPIAAGDRMAFARDDAGCEAGSFFFSGYGAQDFRIVCDSPVGNLYGEGRATQCSVLSFGAAVRWLHLVNVG
jgi:hypothetical protein